MKKNWLFLSLILTLAACNAPLNERNGVQVYGDASSGQDSADNSNDGSNNNGGNSNDGGGTSVNNLGQGFIGCNLTPQFQAGQSPSQIGPLGLCKSSIDSRSIAIYFKNGSFNMNDATCFIPTFRDSNGSTVPLGMAQCTMHNAGETKKAYLATNSGQMNGVMIMKYASVNSYFSCMQTYQKVYPIKYNEYLRTCSYGPQCQNLAHQYADQHAKQEQNYICSSFQQNHAYIDLPL